MATGALRVRLVGCCLTLAVAALVAGCSGTAPKPAPMATQSGPSSSPSATTLVTRPEPSKAPTPTLIERSNGASGARAFAQFYVATINYAMYTGDTSAMTRWATPQCSLCESIRADIRDIYTKGGRVEGGGWRVLHSELHQKQAASEARVTLRVLVMKQVIYSKKGAEPSPSVADRGHLELTLVRIRDAWKVARLGAYA